MDKKFITERKRDLLKEKIHIERELKNISIKKDGKYRVIFPNIGDSDEENAIEVATYDRMLHIKRDLMLLKKDVESALAKIKNNKYGLCNKCGKQIDIQRLKAIPEATLCLSCSKK